jgi:hypothetical protein
MANYYVSSVSYNNIPTWMALTGGLATPISVGTIVRQTSPAVDNERCWRCSVAGTTGTTEPTWILTKNSNTTDGTVTWNEITGDESHQHDNGFTNDWAAPSPRIGITTARGPTSSSDTIYVSSDHAETRTNNQTISTGSCKIICVNKTNTNIPPVAAAVTTGATYTITGSAVALTIRNSPFIRGIGFIIGTSGNCSIALNDQGTYQFITLQNCYADFSNTTGNGSFSINPNSGGATVVLDNVYFKFGGTGSGIVVRTGRLIWKNTPNALQGSIFPSKLFFGSGGQNAVVEVHSVDLSALGSNFIYNVGQDNYCVLLNNCKLGSGYSIFTSTLANENERVELVNCTNATSVTYNNEWYWRAGSIVTDTSTVRTGGASDGTTSISRKFVSNSNASEVGSILRHTIFAWNPYSSGSRTATVEVISSTTLFNDELWMEVEYLAGTSSLATVVSTHRATLLTTHSALPTSSAAWVNQPGTPVKQYMQVSFTPAQASLLRVTIHLAKPSQTVWIDPLVTII